MRRLTSRLVSLRRYGNFKVIGPAGGGILPLESAELEETEEDKANNNKVRASKKWVAKCVFCPKVVIASVSDLRSLRRRCPCLDETHVSWRNMIQRCTNPKHDQYKDYGGRDIVVCDEWRNSFQRFVMDMGKRPIGKTLDRRDSDGPYRRQNCRWADAKSQAENRRKPSK